MKEEALWRGHCATLIGVEFEWKVDEGNKSRVRNMVTSAVFFGEFPPSWLEARSLLNFDLIDQFSNLLCRFIKLVLGDALLQQFQA